MPMRLALRRVFRRDPPAPPSARQIAPCPGDRFIEQDDHSTVWEVERVLAPRGGLPGHVVLADPRHARPRRLVAQSSLTDLRRFAPADPSEAPVEGATAA